MNNINNKTSPDQMRILIKRMKGEKEIVKENNNKITAKALSIRDMLKITRKLNEDVNKKTAYDQGTEEQKFLNYFKDINVNIRFIDLEVYDNLVFWGGVVDGIIKFVYKVTPDESTSGVEFDYSEDFSPDNPENDAIIKKIEDYYDIFYKYWSNNLLQR
jgi:hypothetical protein